MLTGVIVPSAMSEFISHCFRIYNVINAGSCLYTNLWPIKVLASLIQLNKYKRSSQHLSELLDLRLFDQLCFKPWHWPLTLFAFLGKPNSHFFFAIIRYCLMIATQQMKSLAYKSRKVLCHSHETFLSPDSPLLFSFI